MALADTIPATSRSPSSSSPLLAAVDPSNPRPSPATTDATTTEANPPFTVIVNKAYRARKVPAELETGPGEQAHSDRVRTPEGYVETAGNGYTRLWEIEQGRLIGLDCQINLERPIASLEAVLLMEQGEEFSRLDGVCHPTFSPSQSRTLKAILDESRRNRSPLNADLIFRDEGRISQSLKNVSLKLEWREVSGELKSLSQPIPFPLDDLVVGGLEADKRRHRNGRQCFLTRQIPERLEAGGLSWSSPPSYTINGETLTAGQGYWIWPEQDEVALDEKGEAALWFRWRTRWNHSPFSNQGEYPPQLKTICRHYTADSSQTIAHFAANSFATGAEEGRYQVTIKVKEGVEFVEGVHSLRVPEVGVSNLIALAFHVDRSARRLISVGQPRGAHVLREAAVLACDSVTAHPLTLGGKKYWTFQTDLFISPTSMGASLPGDGEFHVFYQFTSQENLTDKDMKALAYGLGWRAKLGKNSLESFIDKSKWTWVEDTVKLTPSNLNSPTGEFFLRHGIISPLEGPSWRLGETNRLSFPLNGFALDDFLRGELPNSPPSRGTAVICLVTFVGDRPVLLCEPIVVRLDANNTPSGSQPPSGPPPSRSPLLEVNSGRRCGGELSSAIAGLRRSGHDES